ncbi:hypothetical protein BDR03DRAFT_954909 [Suillus americanus]|nr:hypothetical protein BDR03DRAFT_954909 [Suillus americanus]
MKCDLLSAILLALTTVSPLGVRAMPDSETVTTLSCTWDKCGRTCSGAVADTRGCTLANGILATQYCCD